MKHFQRLLFLVVLCCFAVGAAGQSYTKLWKQADEARENDLPKTALQYVEQIRLKASAEKDMGQMLKAVLVQLQLKASISPDSIPTYVRLLETSLQNETRPAQTALLQSALGQLYLNMAYSESNTRRDSINHLSAHMLQSSVENIDMLAKAHATDYLPVFNIGNDSKKIYHHDLLSVLLQTYLNAESVLPLETRCEKVGEVISYYNKSGNRLAAMMLQVDSLALYKVTVKNLAESPVFHRLLSLRDEYRDLSACSEVYRALMLFGTEHADRNWQNDSLLLSLAKEGLQRLGKNKNTKCLQEFVHSMQQARLQVEFPDELYPGKTYNVTLNATNLKKVRCYFIPDQDQEDFQELSNAKKHSILKKTKHQFDFVLPGAPVGKPVNVKCSFIAPSIGNYVIALCDGYDILGLEEVSCSRLKEMVYSMPNSLHRIAIVDAESGALLQGTRLSEEVTLNYKRESLTYHEPDADGFYYLTRPYDRKRHYYRAVMGDDNYMPGFSLNSTANLDTVKSLRTSTTLFIDRGIYRPGQTVCFSAVSYVQRGDMVSANGGKNLNVYLYDSNNKLVDKQVLTTDDFGHVNGTFALPKHCLPGNFRINATHAAGVYFKVEEFKRPTFTVETEDVRTAYAPGDTIYIKGVAKTYSGVPLSGAKVHFEHSRMKYVYWFRRQNDTNYKVLGDTITDADGRFTIPLVLAVDMTAADRTYFRTQIEVLDMAGERVSAEKNVAVAYVKGRLSHSLGSMINLNRDTVFQIQFNNAMNVNIPVMGHATIYREGKGKATFDFKTGENITLPVASLQPSGPFTMTYGLEYEGTLYQDTVKFVAFSETDCKLPEENGFFVKNYFNTRRDTAVVLIGTSKPQVTVFYDVYSGGSRPVISERMLLSDTLLRMEIPYLPAYADGAVVTFRTLYENEVKECSFEISKPLPEKKLQLQWETFRSNLMPGQHETWKLRVKHADGSPANAAVMARMYDASLDALNDYRWNFNITFPRLIPSAYWQYSSVGTASFDLDRMTNVSFARTLVFTDWQYDLFNSIRWDKDPGYFLGGQIAGLDSSVKRRKSATVLREVRAESVQSNVAMAMPVMKAVETGSAVADEEPEAEVRQNFAETAFFQPTLRTDSTGMISIEFTLPESLTQWNCQALANTRNMEYGEISSKATAQKKLMVQPAMPRFLRQGDAPEIPVRLFNLTDAAQSVQLVFRLLDAKTEKTLVTLKQKVKVDANGQNVAYFRIDSKHLRSHDVVICRVVGVTSDFSDGEENLIPILSDREQVISTLPLSLDNVGVTTYRIDTLWSDSKQADNQCLSVEISTNPLWYVVNALPVLTNQTCRSASEWMENLYAITLAQYIAQENPDIRKIFETADENSGWQAVLERNADLKQTLLSESPWVVAGENEKQRASALSQLFDEYFMQLKHATALDHLKVLQQPDGSWSWYPSMPGSIWVTASILYHMARLKHLTKRKDSDAMFEAGMKYMEKAAHKEVIQMKKYKQSYCSFAMIKYLYARALTSMTAKGEVQSDIQYLVNALSKQVPAADMHTKALASVVLAFYGKDDVAKTTLQSLLEYTVYTPEMGRYFDTRRAPITYSSYRMPTQTATVEALSMFGVGQTEADEMCRWMIQSKRTQIWETSDATLDAVYILLKQYGANLSDADENNTKASQPLQYTLMKRNKPVGLNAPAQAKGAATVGYYKDTYNSGDALAANAIKVRKTSENLSWGSVYAQYTLPMNEVKRGGHGLSVEQVLEVKQGNGWKVLNSSETLPKGTHVRIVLRIQSDRDFDYVSLKAGRAACMEPIHPLSGYVFFGFGGTYRVVRDMNTEYFFEHLPKGKSEVVEEFYLDRTGTYQCAPAKLQSIYSPEYTAVSGSSSVIRVKE